MEYHHLIKLQSPAVVIAVLGTTGTGKSSFVSTITEEDAGIGNSLSSCTSAIGVYSMIHRTGLPIYLVDTPGFDDTWQNDVDILKEIVFFFAQVYRGGIHLAGIAYLHPITDNRVNRCGMKNLRMLQQLCGPEAAKHIVFVSTMWNSRWYGSEIYHSWVRREEELIRTPTLWGSMCQHGSQVTRWFGEELSALSVIDILVESYLSDGEISLRVQHEIVSEKKEFWELSAAKELSRDLKKLQEDVEKDLESLRASAELNGCLGHIRLDQSIRISVLKLEKSLREIREVDDKFYASVESLFSAKRGYYARILTDTENERKSIEKDLCRQQHKCVKLKEESHRNQELFKEMEKEHGVESKEQMEMYREDMELISVQYRIEQEANEAERHEIESEMKRRKKKVLFKKNIIPILAILSGAGVAAAGGALGIIPVAAAGIGLVGNGVASIKLSSKDKKKEDEE